MRLYLCGFLLLFDDLSVSLSSSLSSSSSSSLSPEFVDCVRASEECNLSPQCSSRYRIMRQCLVGKDWNSMLANKECQAALEVLQETPLVECRCKRGMKKELQCLQNYWSIHMGLSEDDLSVSLSSSLSSSSSSSLSPEFVDCVRASEECNLSPQCSSRYRIMRQCLVGKDWNSMLANKECQAALEVLQETPLVECRCKRGMKKELQCLQNYWSIHMGLSEGEDFYEASPYEPLPPVRHTDAFRLASIISGMNTGTSKAQSPCPDPSGTCNQCLDATKACNLNDNCKRQRSNYISTCTRSECNRKRCHKALRQFLERVQSQYSFGLLFCSCQDHGCAERRRQTIVPTCAYEDKLKPNCLQLRKTCRLDPFCRSRLADFHTHCQMSDDSISTCPNDDYQACLTAYTGLIGSDMTPNYEDANHTDFSISPWCSCRNSGNQEEECEKFLRDFRENTCLRNAIQAFGTDIPKTTASTNPEVSRTNPTAYHNITKPEYDNDPKCSASKGFICEDDEDSMGIDENPEWNPSNRSVGLKLCLEAWMLSLLFAVGNSAL